MHGRSLGRASDGSSGKKKKTYICANGTWREASTAEKASKALCTKNNEDSFATDSSDKKNVKVYVCKDSLWTEDSAVEQGGRLGLLQVRGVPRR